MYEIKNVPFKGKAIQTINVDGEIRVLVKSECERLGSSWGSQRDKLAADASRWGYTVISIWENGRPLRVGTIPLEKYFSWLTSINPAKVNPEIRSTFEQYCMESDSALWDYWTKGAAINPRVAVAPDAHVAAGEIKGYLAGYQRGFVAALDLYQIEEPAKVTEFIRLRRLGLTGEQARKALDLRKKDVETIEELCNNVGHPLPVGHNVTAAKSWRDVLGGITTPNAVTP